uniref:Lipocalin/cytosolic fatty-acid binding domain-containing protein n=1 Tax=Cavia porcellus TaxID=10141 RepID=H0UZ58_CAVPO
MELGLLCRSLILLWALPIKAQDSFPYMIRILPLSSVPLQPDFQDDQFQGKWYAVGVADNTIQNGNESNLTMYSINYELKEDHSFNMNTTLLRDNVCEYSMKTLIPSFQPGHFSLHNLRSYRGMMSYTVRVVATNYFEFAMVYRQKIVRFKVYYKITLYGRTKELSPELKERFIKFAKTLCLTEDNVTFPVPVEECIDD